MKKLRATSTVLTFACIVALVALGCGKSVDESKLPVARVGRHTITQKEYKEAFSRLVPPEHAGVGTELKELKRDLINQLIEERLILDQARAMGLVVEDSELDAEISAIRNEYGDESFESKIKEQYGAVSKWRAQIKKRLVIRKVKANVTGTGTGTGVTDGEILAYYKEHKKEYNVAPQVHARMIFVDSEEKAASILKGLSVSNFADVASEVSLSPDRDIGGDLGFFARGEMPREFEDVVFSLKPGTISPVVKTPYGFHIFLVEAKRKGRKLRLSQVRESIRERLASEGADSEFGDWVASLKKNVKIVVNEDLL